MEITVKKWGNSLGVRIPRMMAKDLKLEDGLIMQIEDTNGTIIISPKRDGLSQMLNRITDSNIHNETDFGKPEGKELW